MLGFGVLFGFVVSFSFDVGFGLGLGGVGDMFGFGFSLGFGSFGIFCAVKFVHGADNDEDDEGDEEEVDDVLEEVAVGDVGDGVSAEDVGDVEGEAGEVEAAGEEAGDRHDDIIDEGFDDGGEGATDGDTDCEVDDAAAVDEFLELLDEVALGDFCDETLRGSGRDGGAVLGGVGGIFCSHAIYYIIWLRHRNNFVGSEKISNDIFSFALLVIS